MFKTKIGHAHLKVTDLERSIAFYTNFLELRVTERIGAQYAFLTSGGMHHEIALQQVGPAAPRPAPDSVGLYHIAFEVPGGRDFALAYKHLTHNGIQVFPVNHLISWALYFNDPDDNGLEIYWDIRRESFGKEVWKGKSLALQEEQLLGLLEQDQ